MLVYEEYSTLVSSPVTDRVSNTCADMMIGIFRANAKPINSSVWHLMKFASRRIQSIEQESDGVELSGVEVIRW